MKDDVNVWILSCHQGKPKLTENWAKNMGAEPENVHGYPKTSNSKYSADFLRDVLTGKDPEEAFYKYTKLNDIWNAAGQPDLRKYTIDIEIKNKNGMKGK